MMNYTVCWRNSMLGTSGFRGTFATQDEAAAFAAKEASHARSFASFEVWIGTPSNPIKAVEGTLVNGTK